MIISGIIENTAKNKKDLERSRGGFSTKIHCVTDTLGNPLEFVVTEVEIQ